MTLKKMFLNAIITGEIGKNIKGSIFIETGEFKNYFKQAIFSNYIGTFLPAATIEKGRSEATHTKYLFRVKRGVYRVHYGAIKEQIEKNIQEECDEFYLKQIK